MGRREEKKQETRERLQAAAFALFERRGYDRTKVEDIARAAGVSPRTVYRYFPTKAELVYWDTAGNIEHLQNLIASRPKSESSFAAMRAAFVEFAPNLDTTVTVDRGRLIAADPTLYRFSLEVRDEIGTAVGQALIARGGDRASDAERRLLGHLGMAALLAALREWRDSGPERMQLPEYLASLLDSMASLVTMGR
jgi:AcrR family transcriptional regulator